MHTQVRTFIESCKSNYPTYFRNQRVLEMGSYNVNGSPRTHFTDCDYTGVDIHEGPGVDVVALAHEYTDDLPYDVIVSTEMLEHDPHWRLSIHNMCQLLRPGGALILTCATTPRNPHGTEAYPDGTGLYGPDPHYYRNLTAQEVASKVQSEGFHTWVQTNNMHGDIYLWAIKQGEEPND